MSTRKSCRRRTLTAKVQALNEANTNKAVHKRDLDHEHSAKRRKTTPSIATKAEPAAHRASAPDRLTDDKMDPVEKLLSMTHVNNDILLQMEDTEALLASPSPAVSTLPHHSLSHNFTKIINDNIRKYYQTFRKLPMEIHNDHSSFSVLTRPQPAPSAPVAPVASAQIPFFKNVNFNRSPSAGHCINDYIYCDDDEVSSTDSEHEDFGADSPLQSPVAPPGKMSFHYRQHDKLNLSLTPDAKGPEDVSQFLNLRSVMSGRASEMIGTSTFMINEFFF